PQPPLKRPRRGGSWQPELSLQPCDQQLLLAVRRCSRDVQNVLQGARLRVDRSCGVTDVAKADLQLIGQVVSDAFKRWREAYAELLSQLRVVASMLACSAGNAPATAAPLFGRAELDARLFELQRLPEASDAADDLAETEACAGDFLDQLDDKLAKLGSTAPIDVKSSVLQADSQFQPERDLGSIVELIKSTAGTCKCARPVQLRDLLLGQGEKAEKKQEAKEAAVSERAQESVDNDHSQSEANSNLLLIVAHHVSLPAAVLLSSLPSLAEASKTIRAQLVVCLFGCGIVSTKPTKAASSLASAVYKILDNTNGSVGVVVASSDSRLARRAGFTNGLRRVWSPESAQCLAQATVDQEDEKEASSTSSSSTKHLVRQHLNPPVMEEDIREVCRHLGGAVLLSAAADSSTLSVLRLYRCSDFSDLPTAAWLIESSGNRQQTRVALEHSELSLPASTAPPEMSRLQYEPSSGLYYDPVTGLYYSSSSRLFYDASNCRYLFWDDSTMRYWSTSDSDRYSRWLAAWAAAETG
ncbi:hypothetical protein BOX15_Mlig025226g4, partial [Macrostomum lignano]